MKSESGNGGFRYDFGISLRDCFSIAILSAMISADSDEFMGLTHISRAKWVYAQADAMLKARKEKL